MVVRRPVADLDVYFRQVRSGLALAIALLLAAAVCGCGAGQGVSRERAMRGSAAEGVTVAAPSDGEQVASGSGADSKAVPATSLLLPPGVRAWAITADPMTGELLLIGDALWDAKGRVLARYFFSEPYEVRWNASGTQAVVLGGNEVTLLTRQGTTWNCSTIASETMNHFSASAWWHGDRLNVVRISKAGKIEHYLDGVLQGAFVPGYLPLAVSPDGTWVLARRGTSDDDFGGHYALRLRRGRVVEATQVPYPADSDDYIPTFIREVGKGEVVMGLSTTLSGIPSGFSLSKNRKAGDRVLPMTEALRLKLSKADYQSLGVDVWWVSQGVPVDAGSGQTVWTLSARGNSGIMAAVLSRGSEWSVMALVNGNLSSCVSGGLYHVMDLTDDLGIVIEGWRLPRALAGLQRKTGGKRTTSH